MCASSTAAAGGQSIAGTIIFPACGHAHGDPISHGTLTLRLAIPPRTFLVTQVVGKSIPQCYWESQGAAVVNLQKFLLNVGTNSGTGSLAPIQPS